MTWWLLLAPFVPLAVIAFEAWTSKTGDVPRWLAIAFVIWFVGGAVVTVRLAMARQFRPYSTFVLWSVMTLVGSLGGIWARSLFPKDQFAACAERAKPLIAALDQFVADFGKAPEQLRDLVPSYLSRVPSTGLSKWPNWNYGPVSGEPYELLVSCGSMFGFDKFVYWPSGQYPASLYGGSTERIGAWVYVHE